MSNKLNGLKSLVKGLKANSVLSQRTSLSGMLGTMFGGKRKMYDIFGYSKTISYTEVLARYRRQDIMTRVVDAPANALWNNPPVVTSNNAEWDKIWNELVINQGLYQILSRVDKMSGMGEFAALLIGVDATHDLALPIEGGLKRKLLYLQPYGQDAVSISAVHGDPGKASYMQPATYSITPNVSSNVPVTNISGMPKMFKVDASRILHVGENYLNDTVFGNPRVERIWNLLDDLMKIVGGTAETFWLTANRGMQIDVDKEMELTEEDEEALTDEIEDYVNQLRRFVRTRGVKINSLGSDVPNPQNIFNMILSLISGTTGIPKRILLGSEAGHLASEQDRQNWSDKIEERRKEFGEPTILWPLIKKLTQAGVLPNTAGLKIEINWPDAFKLTPLELDAAKNNRARAAVGLAQARTTSPDLMTNDEARTILGFNEPKNIVESNTLVPVGKAK